MVSDPDSNRLWLSASGSVELRHRRLESLDVPGARAAASAEQTYARCNPAECLGDQIIRRYDVDEIPVWLGEVS